MQYLLNVRLINGKCQYGTHEEYTRYWALIGFFVIGHLNGYTPLGSSQ